MRVIGGKLKGSVLLGDNIIGTRPTLARVKESLFATIQEKVTDSVCLDLFAGSGSLGIEAISMGAKEVYFVDHQKKAYDILKKNIAKLKITNFSKIYKQDFILFLKNINIKFDIVFLDPPYNSDFIKKSIELLISLDLLNKKALIICETDNLDLVPKPLELNIRKEKKYGDKHIVIFEKV